MDAMDVYWHTYFNGEGSTEWKQRGQALDQAITSKKGVMSAMEIGSYCGYTAVRIGRLLPDDAKLVSVEIDPLFAAIATKVSAATPAPSPPPPSSWQPPAIAGTGSLS
jgi:predicted O-methyltransferase YrrM